jgi:iron complex transport system ATP-binding protein
MQIAVRDIEVGYGEKPVLHGINATFPAGRMSGIIGPNGSGKSTLLKVIGRQLTPSCGTVRIDGQSLSSIHSR